MSDSLKLQVNGSEAELPIIKGSEGEVGIDIGKLRGQTGAVTLDPGYVNTGSCTSDITFLNGEQGILRYRGYTIEELAEKSSFIEVAYLLINGELPNQTQLDELRGRITEQNKIHPAVDQLLRTFPKDAHPMGALSAALGAMSGHYPQFNNPDIDHKGREEAMALLMGQVKHIAAAFYRYTQGESAVESRKDLSYASDFIQLMFSKGSGDDIDEAVAHALDVLLILHADHEQNCSTSTVRMVGSAKANVFASMASGVNALWGPLHGGANQAVIEMLDQIAADGGDHKKYLAKAKDKNDSFRLMGFGHRVYKNFDPRARIIKKACDTVLTKLGVHDPVLDIAKGLEEEALRDEYFVERKLYPNVDFYSGIIYRALGIPTNMFTVMFALGRMPGWLAQWNEMLESNTFRICRPRQIYTGPNQRSYTDIGSR